MRPTGQQDRALDGTHGRIKRRKKSFYEMKKSCLRKTHFVTGCHDLEVNKSLFYKGFRTQRGRFWMWTINLSSPSKIGF